MNIKSNFTTDNFYDGAYYYGLDNASSYSIGNIQQTIDNDVRGYSFAQSLEYFGNNGISFFVNPTPDENGMVPVDITINPTVNISYGGYVNYCIYAVSAEEESDVKSNTIDFKVYTGPIKNEIFYRLKWDDSTYEALSLNNNISGEVNITSEFKYSSKTIKTTEIAEKGFISSSRITSVNLEGEITYIGNYAFADCSSLSAVAVPNVEYSIGQHAFENCTSLDAIDFKDHLSSIGDYAFSGCTNLTAIYFMNTETGWLSNISDNAFDRCDIQWIYVPTDSVDSYKTALQGVSWAIDATIEGYNA